MAKPLKWEFDIVLSELFPFLNASEQRRFGQVNRTMHEWIEEAAKIHFQRNHIEDTELRRFFHFTRNCKQHLTRKIMFDRYKELRRKALLRAPKHLPVSRASLSVLIFYLYQNNRRALQHLVHCSRKFYPELRRMFLRVWLRVQMYCSRYSINRASAASVASLQTSGMNLLKTSKLNQSTPSTLLSRKRERGGSGGSSGSGSVAQRAGKRKRSTVKRYVPECKKFLDDKSEEEESEVDLSADSGLEERSDSSDSEGSLRDFIVNDEEEDSDKASSYDSGAKERELSDGETSCESDFSVYSD